MSIPDDLRIPARRPVRPRAPTPPEPTPSRVAEARAATRAPQTASRRPPPVLRITRPEAQAETTTRTRTLERATAQVGELQRQQRNAPGGLRHEYQDMLRTARANVSMRRSELADAMETEYRLSAQQTTPDTGRNLYGEQSRNLESREVAPAARSDRDIAAVQGRRQALAAEPANLNEAQWQRTAEVWEAQDAQWNLERRLAAAAPAVEQNGTMMDAGLEASRAEAGRQWGDVRDAFRAEYDLVAAGQGGSPVSGTTSTSTSTTAYRARIERQTFNPRYREQILDAAAPVVDTAPLEAAITARVDREVRTVETGLRTNGAPAAFDAMVAAKQRLVDDPVVAGNSMPDDPAVLALAQQQLDERLRPLQQQIAAAAPEDLRRRAAAPASTSAEKYARAQDVSARLAQYANELPADLVPALVEQSRGAWAPAIAFLGEQSNIADSSRPATSRGDVRPRPTAEFNAVVANFAEVGEALAAAPNGDAALLSMAGEFAGAIGDRRIGAFDEAFGRDGVGRGADAHLAVEVVNRLAGSDATRDTADDLLGGLQEGNQVWAEAAQQRLSDFAANREELNHYVGTFPGGTRALQAGDLSNQADPTAMELRDAVNDYLERNPEVRRRDAELLQGIDADGLHLLHLELALQGLSPKASRLDHAASVGDPVREMLAPDGAAADDQGPALWQIYANTPSVNAEYGRFTAQVAAHRESALAAGAVDTQGTLPALVSSQSFLAMPRNARFMALELVHPQIGVPGMRTDVLANSQLVRLSGVGFFGAAAGGAFLDAAGYGNQQLGGWDRAVAAARGLNYSYIGGRDSVKVGVEALSRFLAPRDAARYARTANMLGSLESLHQATGPVGKEYKGTHIALAKGLQLASRGLFIATDGYALANDIADGRNGGVIAGDTLNLAGSAVMVADAAIVAGIAPAWAATSWAGPVAWVGTGLWTAGAVTKYQFDRVERSDRFETADQRRFLAHFGTRKADGDLHVPGPNDMVEVSNATDHDPEIRTVRYRDRGPDDIVYSGLSANGVDELMNYSGSPDDPVSGTRALDALAASRGVDTRRFYLDWFEGSGAFAGLDHQQRKELTVAAQGVDPASIGRGITDETLAMAWNRAWPDMQSYAVPTDPNRVSDEDRAALTTYVGEQGVMRYPNNPQGYGPLPETDPSKLRLLLGLRRPNPGEQAPTPEVRAAAEHVLADTAIYGREMVNDGGMRPKTVDELDYWMRLHDYPPLPAAQAPVAAGPRPQPAAPPPEPIVPPERATPIDHEYIVQPGDNLWDIAERSGTSTDVGQLMAYHNANNPPARTDFDPQRADSDFDTPAAPGDARRDPDLIQPGEVIYVTDEADIRRA